MKRKSFINSSAHILIIAGETSGDLLGSLLIQSLKKQNPYLTFSAMGSSRIQASGAQMLVDAKKLALVGVVDIILNLRLIYQTFRSIKQFISQQKPDLIILIDYPGFNLKIAKFAKKKGIKVMYYVSPQIWAWHYSRIYKIKNCIDHMVVLFSFEKEIYEKENIPVTFSGHPLLSFVKPSLQKEAILNKYHLNKEGPIIALLPGSRQSEISRLLADMIESTKLILEKIANAQFVLALAPNFSKNTLSFTLPDYIKIIENDTYNILSISHAAVCVSGTVTLETALLQIPLVVIYRFSKLNYWIGKYLLKIKLGYFALCNIVNREPVAKELFQNAVTAPAIAAEIVQLLQDASYRTAILNRLAFTPTQLSNGSDASDSAAAVAFSLLKSS